MSASSLAACESGTQNISTEPRILGLAMVPGKHIVSIHIDNIYSNANKTRPRPTHHSSSKKICLREESFYPQQISLSQLKDKKVDYVLY